MYNHYSNDPRWITAKFTSSCNKCHHAISKGQRILYFPATKTVECQACGEVEYRQFQAAAMDEYNYNN